MRLGLHFTNFTHPGGATVRPGALGDTAVAASQAGADGFTVARPLAELG